jgi:hypothetical protein
VAYDQQRGWALLETAQGARFRLDEHSGELTAVDVQVPSGLRPITRGSGVGVALLGSGALGFDSGGALLAALRDDYAGRIYRSSDGGQSWLGVGATVSTVAQLRASDRGGTFVIQGSLADCYWSEAQALKDLAWLTPPRGREPQIVGDAAQIARPVDGTTILLPDPAPAAAISDDGLCIAHWEKGEGGTASLAAYDAQRGRRFDLVRLPQPADDATHPSIWLSPENQE